MNEEELQTLQGARTRVHPEPLGVDAPSLKDALRKRPGADEDMVQRALSTVKQWTGTTWVSRAELHDGNPKNKRRSQRHKDTSDVICTPMWTAAEFRTFDRLTLMSCSGNQGERTRAKEWLKRFTDKHGDEICSMMLAEIRRRDEQAWFKDKNRTRGA